VTVYAVSDLMPAQTSVLSVALQLVRWDGDGVSSEPFVVWKQDGIAVAGGTSKTLASVAVTAELLAAAGCTASSCYAKTVATATASTSAAAVVVSPSVEFLSPVKTNTLTDNPHITVANVQQVDAQTVSFDVSVNASSPFLFLEINNLDFPPTTALPAGGGAGGINGASAGWFSDNNFVAEKGQVYRLTYSSYAVLLSVADFKQQIQARVLQHAYDCTLSLKPVIV
jgi:hypothetical protein